MRKHFTIYSIKSYNNLLELLQDNSLLFEKTMKKMINLQQIL